MSQQAQADVEDAATQGLFTCPHRFRDQVVVVTGAAGGIGSAIIARAAREGAHVVAADRRPDGEQLVREFLGHNAAGWLYVDKDLAHEAGAQQLIDTAVERFGRVDVLVNNAGGE